MGRIWHEYGLGIALAALFLVSWAGQGIAEWQVYAAEEWVHGAELDLGGFLWTFAQSTLENWQSEFLQLLTFVVLARFLVFRGSPQSRDVDDDTTARLERIERRLRDRDGGAS